MRLPKFTAETSLDRFGAKYSFFSARADWPEAAAVTAQALVAGRSGLGFWFCPPPFCGRDEYGRCHCLTVTFGGEAL